MNYEIDPNINYGFDPIKEQQDQRPDDWEFGAAPRGLAEDIDAEEFLPTGEVQRGSEDTMDCATRAPINLLETKLNYLIRNKLLREENIKWLYDTGFMDKNGSIGLSDAFPAILSGTRRTGNSLKAPLEAMRKNGCVPKSLMPLEKSMDWAQYHNPARITPEIREIGLEFAHRFPINYERVYLKDFFRTKDIVDVAGHAWSHPVNGVYPRTDRPMNHAFLWFSRPLYKIFDNYLDRKIAGDYIKQLASDYKLLYYGYRVILNEVAEVKKKMIPLRREKGGKKVYAISGGAKYWIVKWSNLNDFLSSFGYDNLKQAQDAVLEVEKGHLDKYITEGVVGNPSLLDIIFGKTK